MTDTSFSPVISGKQRVPRYKLLNNESFTITETCFAFGAHNIGDSDANLLGDNLKPATGVELSAGGYNNTFEPNTVQVDATGTIVILTYVV